MDERSQELRRAIHGDEHASVESMPRPMMLDIRPSKGPWVALPYIALRRVEYDPDRRPAVLIEFSSHTIEVQGRKLEGLYLAVVGQRASVLSEVQELYIEDDREGTAVIQKLTIQKKSKRGEGAEDES
ncbi:MAG: hypothetical protein CMJ31_08885 [Phycisphaerae bacterium]|nr:hypothetical protein [Phycisphaerae bacterium]